MDRVKINQEAEDTISIKRTRCEPATRRTIWTKRVYGGLIRVLLDRRSLETLDEIQGCTFTPSSHIDL